MSKPICRGSIPFFTRYGSRADYGVIHVFRTADRYLLVARLGDTTVCSAEYTTRDGTHVPDLGSSHVPQPLLSRLAGLVWHDIAQHLQDSGYSGVFPFALYDWSPDNRWDVLTERLPDKDITLTNAALIRLAEDCARDPYYRWFGAYLMKQTDWINTCSPAERERLEEVVRRIPLLIPALPSMYLQKIPSSDQLWQTSVMQRIVTGRTDWSLEWAYHEVLYAWNSNIVHDIKYLKKYCTSEEIPENTAGTACVIIHEILVMLDKIFSQPPVKLQSLLAAFDQIHRLRVFGYGKPKEAAVNAMQKRLDAIIANLECRAVSKPPCFAPMCEEHP
ncbi:MAG TPA: hypothetical protein PK297_09835 [Spirochaetota bacterium]|nr:hypothetical protein [Spirochaetota bacterium]